MSAVIAVILVLNAGSSSLKTSVFRVEDGKLLIRVQVDGIDTAPRLRLFGAAGETIEDQMLGGAFDHDQALAVVFEQLKSRVRSHLAAVGHRVVHGGMKFTAPVRIDDAVLAELDRLIPLAPLHQPHNLAAIRGVSRQAPHLPQVTCFDTAFHHTQPEVAQRFGLPRPFTDEGTRRYGFHGLSYEYIASVLPRIDAVAAAGRTVVAHLGNGTSLGAMLAGKSVATTMGFTPADGLIMGTRVGSLDPGVVIDLMDRYKLDARAIEKLIYHESGLLGVSGISRDMRVLLASSDSRAAEAIDLFVYRIGRELGSMAAALRGVDSLVFTGGIGENAAVIRDRICRDAGWLGPLRVHVIPTNEEFMIAKHTEHVLGLNGVIS